MIKKIINEIKNEWKKNKVITGFMGVVVLLAILSYLKPSYTQTIWGYLGITAINLTILGALIFISWWFYLRRKIK